MTVTTETPIASSTANGVTTVFPYAFTVLAAADLVVMGSLNGVSTIYTLGVNYTVAGVGSPAGSVTFLVAPANATVITRYRDSVIARATDYQDNGDFLADIVNLDFDRLWLLLQEIFSGGKGVPNALRVPNGETVPPLASAVNRANRVLGFDGNGNPIATLPTAGDATSLALDLADNVNAVKGDALLGVTQPFAGATARTQHSKNAERVSVRDFGAVGNGIANDTAAFNLALASGKAVFVPAGSYLVANVAVVSGMDIEGEGAGPSTKTTLLVMTNGAGAFHHSANTNIEGVRIANMKIVANAGVLTARGFRQSDRTFYTAYAVFEGIESDHSLEVSYEGFFIFTQWRRCRDGYNGNAPGGQQHQFITSIPAAFGQAQQSNLNFVSDCQAFRGTAGAVASIDIAYGENWSFDRYDNEASACPALRVRGIYGGSLRHCWIEFNSAPAPYIIGLSPAPNPQHSTSWVFDNCFVHLGNNTVQAVSIEAGSSASFVNNTFIVIPAGVVLTTNKLGLVEQYGNNPLNGAGQAGFQTGARARRSSVEFLADVVYSPQALNINMLPRGPVGFGAANFVNNGFTLIADVASAVGLVENAVRFTLVGGNNAASYSLPSKLVTFLQGKTVTFVATGYGDIVGSEELRALVWDSVAVPSNVNATASAVSPATIAVLNVALQTTYVTLTVGVAATSLAVGFGAGGSAAGRVVTIESLRLVLGEIKPSAAGFK